MNLSSYISSKVEMGCFWSKQDDGSHSQDTTNYTTTYIPYMSATHTIYPYSSTTQPILSPDNSYTYFNAYDPSTYNTAYVSQNNNASYPVYYSFPPLESFEDNQSSTPSFYYQLPLQPESCSN
jgi:hypothetical protein